LRMFRVRLICAGVCLVVLVPLVFVADLSDWPRGVVYALIFVLVLSILLLEERLAEWDKRRRQDAGARPDLLR
jgi:hypothetical protein